MKTSVKSKKQIALLSAGALLSLGIAATAGGLTASAEAEKITGSTGSQTSTTGTTVELPADAETWTVTIPERLEIGGAGVAITASGKLKEGHVLEVTASTQSGWKIGGQSYQLKCGDNTVTKNDDKVCEFTAAQLAALEADGTVSSDEVKASLTGKYNYAHDSATDTVTFKVENKEGV